MSQSKHHYQLKHRHIASECIHHSAIAVFQGKCLPRICNVGPHLISLKSGSTVEFGTNMCCPWKKWLHYYWESPLTESLREVQANRASENDRASETRARVHRCSLFREQPALGRTNGLTGAPLRQSTLGGSCRSKAAMRLHRERDLEQWLHSLW